MNGKRIEPGPGQESVWDYPRPPRLEETNKHIQIVFNGVTIADTRRAKRILETGHPPTYYIPLEDIKTDCLVPRFSTSPDEWKGQAHYYGLMVDEAQIPVAGWYYIDPHPPYEAIKMHVAFYAAPMDACTVNGELVTPQPGSFYGGWITRDIVGPFKGDPDAEF